MESDSWDTPDEGRSPPLLSREELRTLLEESTATHRAVVDAVPNVVLQLGPSGRIERANGALPETFEYERTDVVGKSVDVLLASRDERLKTALAGDELTSRLLGDGSVAAARATARTRCGDVFPVDISVSVVRSAGNLVGFVCVLTDVTRRERARRAAALYRRLVTDFVRPRLRDDLTAAAVHLRRVRDRTSGCEEELSALHEILGGLARTGRMAHRVETVLDSQDDRTAVDLVTAVERVLDRASETHPEVAVSLSLPDSLVASTPPSVDVAVEQLVENACVHSGSPGSVHVAGRVDGGQAVIRIQDDGPGIPEAQVGALDSGTVPRHGTGAGLLLADTVARTAGGQLSIENTDEGARVELCLPLADDEIP